LVLINRPKKAGALVCAISLSSLAVYAQGGDPGTHPGQVKVNSVDGLQYVWIPPGRFTMGCSHGDSECSDDEKPAHDVEITEGFWLGQTAVTVEGWERYSKASEETSVA
jgi:formylglycine-generating enzyme required for sulfatase activity